MYHVSEHRKQFSIDWKKYEDYIDSILKKNRLSYDKSIIVNAKEDMFACRNEIIKAYGEAGWEVTFYNDQRDGSYFRFRYAQPKNTGYYPWE